MKRTDAGNALDPAEESAERSAREPGEESSEALEALEALEAEATALEAAAARRGGLPGARRALLIQGPLVALLAVALLLVGRGGPGAASAATPAAAPAKLALLSPYLDPPTQASGPVEAYVTVRNGGGTADRLLDVSTPWASTVRLVDASGHAQPWITVAAGSSVSLRPGGLHLELTGLRRTPKLHDVIQLDLTFAQSGTVHSFAPVGPANSLTVEDVMHAMDSMDRLPPEK